MYLLINFYIFPQNQPIRQEVPQLSTVTATTPAVSSVPRMTTVAPAVPAPAPQVPTKRVVINAAPPAHAPVKSEVVTKPIVTQQPPR